MSSFFDDILGCSPRARFWLFLVSVATRAALAGVVVWIGETKDNAYMTGVAAATGAGALFFLLRIVCNPCEACSKYGVWWFRSVHAEFYAISSVTAITAITSDTPRWMPGAVLAADVTFGVLTAVVRRPFSHAYVYMDTSIEMT